MIEAKLITGDGKPVIGAIVMLDSIPYDGPISEIAAQSNNDGIVSFDCKSVKGFYAFKISLKNRDLFTLRVKNHSNNDGNILILKL